MDSVRIIPVAYLIAMRLTDRFCSGSLSASIGLFRSLSLRSNSLGTAVALDLIPFQFATWEILDYCFDWDKSWGGLVGMVSWLSTGVHPC